jgi:ketosteroid isomerase-like protein
MSAEANKQLMKELFEELAKGNSRPYLKALSDDFELTVTGQTPWSGTWKGREQVRAFYDAVWANYADQYTTMAVNIIADGDTVVVESRGCVTTVRGDLYNNQYCLVFELKDGKITAQREYADTLLVDRVLGRPPWAQARLPEAVAAG